MGRYSPRVYWQFRDYATELDRMGDAVGPNDMALSDLLWEASARMKKYAERYKEDA